MNPAQRVRVYTPDRNRPTVTGFDLDMDSGLLTIVFSETVNRSSLQVPAISVQGSVDASLSDTYTLAGGESTSYDNPTIEIVISESDVNELKRRTLIATQNTTTYVSFTETLVSDQDGNRVVPVDETEGRPVNTFTPDTTPPQLVQFSLDMNSGEIGLVFSETVRAGSFSVDQLVLTDAAEVVNFTTSMGDLLSDDGTVIQHRFTEDDLNELKRIDLCRSEDDCFLTFTNETITDMNNNSVVPRLLGDAVRVDPYIPDSTPPQITYFAVNMTFGSVTLGFSETVNASTFQLLSLTLHNFLLVSGSTVNYNLTGGTQLTVDNGLTIDFLFNMEDLEFLRRESGIFATRQTSYISAQPSAIMDMSGNPLDSEQFIEEYKIADGYGSDILGPEVVGAFINLTSEILVLTFSETVQASTLNPEEITFLNTSDPNATASVSSYKLTGGNFGTGSEFDDTVMTISLIPDDVLEILARETLATSSENTFLTYTNLLVNDLADPANDARVIPPFQVEFAGDKVDPNVFQFRQLDLSLRRLVLEFNEPVDISTANATFFTLQRTQDIEDTPEDFITLTGGVFGYLDPELNQKRVITLDLNADDYQSIVLERHIGTHRDNTFVALPSGGVLDFASNPLEEIPKRNARRVEEVIADFTQPNLLGFDLDLDLGLMTFSFDNVMNPDIDPTGLAIQSFPDPSPSVQHTFQAGYTNSLPGYVLEMVIEAMDLNELKRLTGIATLESNTYLSVSGEFIRSYGGPLVAGMLGEGVSLRAITRGDAVIVSNFTADTTNPTLSSFDLDLNVGELRLTFDETMDASSLVIQELVLQNDMSNATRLFSLTDRGEVGLPTTSSQEDDTEITVFLGFADMNDIKRFVELATDKNDTYLSFANTTLVDMNNNSISAISHLNARQVLMYYEDKEPPVLTDFSLDMNFGVLTLTFTETVNVSSLQTVEITLKDTEDTGEYETLTYSSYSDTENDYIVVVNISVSDLNAIKRAQTLAQDVSSTYISITPETIRDMNANDVVPIGFFSAKQVFEYEPDVTEPFLLSFHLDMDSGTLDLTFDETVDVSTFKFSGFTLYSGPNLTAAAHHNLMDGSYKLDDTHLPTLELNILDQYAIKLLTDLGTSLDDSYLLVEYASVLDMALDANPINETFLKASNFTPDTTPPKLLSFTADLNSSSLMLVFDEPVNASSLRFDFFTLQSSTVDYTEFTLNDGSSDSMNGRPITIQILEDDLNEIKKLEDLFVSEETTYLRFMFGAVRDMAGNEILEVNSSAAFPSSDFTDDTTRPGLLSFHLDMDAEVLTLYFSETVDYTSLMVTAIGLQKDFAVSNFSDAYNLTGGTVSPLDDRTVMVNLTTEDLNSLKTLRIATSNSSTWLTLESGGIRDQSSEFALPRVNGKSALPVESYTPDSTKPTLDSFQLDLDKGGLLWLTFSETVDRRTLTATSITLQNSMERSTDNNTYHTLSSASATWDYDLPIQRISVAKGDLDELKRLFLLATDTNDTFLSVAPGGVSDVFRNPLVEINQTRALQAYDVIPDTTLPRLVSYNLNLTSELLELTFSETVNATSLQVQSFSLWEESPTTAQSSSFALTGNSTLLEGSVDSTMIPILVGTGDLNEIKDLVDLAVSNDTTFLSISSSGISDMSDNSLVGVATSLPREVSIFTDDRTRPTVSGFSLDMNEGVLTLTFDETVNSTSFRPETITLLGEQSNSTDQKVTLSGSQSSTRIDLTMIEVLLLDSDLNEVKRLRGLATNESTTFLAFTEEMVADMNSNLVVPRSEEDALVVQAYVNDSSNPRLVAFDLDLSLEILSLTFSETVRASTLDVEQITLQNEIYTQFVELTMGMVISNDSTVVMVTLETFDLNRIKYMLDLATHENNTYISVTPFTIRDMNTNHNDPIMQLMVSNFTADFVRPVLESFVLDMDGAGMLTLSFSETVDASSVDVTQITLVSDPAVDTYQYTLSALSYTMSLNGPILVIHLHISDINMLKIIPQLATSRFATYISITEDLVLDMNNNTNVAINISNALMADDVIMDITDPEIDSFGLDMNEGVLMLNFSETVAGQSLIRMNFTLQNESNSSLSYFSLLDLPISLPVYFTLSINLTTDELNQIKKMTSLATSVEDTWLTVDYGALEDVTGNGLVALPFSDALQAVYFVPDTTDPRLLYFDIDLNSGVLTLVFDETVLATSLNLSAVMLKDTPDNITNNTYTLTDGTWAFEDSTEISVVLSFYDLNQIKKIRGLASVSPVNDSIGNTFISISANAVVDMNGNHVVEIPASSAMEVRNITLDSTRPQLVSFDFNLDSEQLVLTFDETVDTTTLSVTQFTFVGQDEGANYTLTAGGTPSEDDYIIVIQLDIDDVNNIKRDPAVAVDNTTTHLLLSSTAILDMNSNLLNFSQVVLQVSEYYPDTRPPVLLSFDLDLDASTLLLTFNETVNITSLRAWEITLQNNFSVSLADKGAYHSLETGVPLTPDSPILELELQPVDTNLIKALTHLATNTDNTFLSLSHLTVLDMAGNAIVGVPHDSALQVRNFTEDTSPPQLVLYEFDLTSEEIHFVFNETVDVSSLDATQITLSGDSNSSYTLAGGVIASGNDSTNVTLSLTTPDLNEIKKDESLATTVMNIFISYGQAFLVDMNNNPVVPESDTIADMFVPDTVKPELLFFHLDLDEGLLHLTFSETVRVLSLNATSFVFLNQSGNYTFASSSYYRLTEGGSQSSDGPEITLNISTSDLNNIKRISNLATEEDDTYLLVETSGIQDMNQNRIVLSPPFRASNFTPDTTSPALQSFHLDMDSDILWLTFNETMLVSSLQDSEITFVSGPDLHSASRYTLQSSQLLPGSIDDTVVPVRLSLVDSNEIKKIVDLATSLNDTYLLLTNETLTDMNFNDVVAISLPFPAANFTEDTTRPTLEFSVNLDSRMLQLSFSETVNATSLMVEAITLQNSALASGEAVTLTSQSYSNSSDGPVLSIHLSIVDSNRLTSLTHLYNSLNDSYLTATSLTVQDMASNLLIPIPDGNGTQAIGYTPDTTNSTLLQFSVDLDNWTLTLSFDETVAAETLDYRQLHLYSDQEGSINLTLTNGSFNLPYTHEVIVYLTQTDVDRVKVTEYLWTSVNDTWLFIEGGAVYDWTLMNPVNQRIIQAVEPPVENLPPNLLSFFVNITSGMLVLNFDEPVRTVNLMPQLFILQNREVNATQDYRLTGGTSSSPNGKQITLQLTNKDLNAIKALTDLYTSPNTTYLTLQRGAITDMLDHPSVPVEGLRASVYVNDTKDPYLVSYDLDMDAGLIVFTFSETVDVSSFDVASFTIQVDSNISYSDPFSYHTFSDSTVAQTSDVTNMLDNRVVLLNISLYDLNEMKRKEVASSRNTSWLVFMEDALTDNNLQPVAPLINGINARQPANYTDDTTEPRLLSFDLSLNEGTLVLYFSETVDATTLSVGGIALQSSPLMNASESFTLTNTSLCPPEPLSVPPFYVHDNVSVNGTYVIVTQPEDAMLTGSVNDSATANTSACVFQPPSSFNSHILTLYFSHFDSDSIKSLTQLASAAAQGNDSFLSVTKETVADMRGNFIEEIPSGGALIVSDYRSDNTTPALRGFDLDIDSGDLTLTFTETVDVSSLDLTQVALQNGPHALSSDFASYTLTSYPPYPLASASFTYPDWNTVVVRLGEVDLDAIKNIRNLATGYHNTFISLTSDAVADNAGNPVVQRSVDQAVNVSVFTADTTPVELLSYDLNMNTGELIISFSETVKIVDTLDVTQITLQSNTTAAMALEVSNSSLYLTEYTLSDVPPFHSMSLESDRRVVTIQIGFTDLNAIKYRTELATSMNNTFLSITNSTVVDLSDNPVTAIPTQSAEPVSNYTADTTGPSLVNFTLDMNTTTLTLVFDEVVDSSSLNVSEIRIQHDNLSSSLYHSSPKQLTPGPNETHTLSDNDYILVVILGPQDRNEIKRRQDLATSLNNTFIVATPEAVFDMSDNRLMEIADGEAQRAVEYVPDTTPPEVDAFSIDMNQGSVMLTFDETVLAASLSVESLSFQDGLFGPTVYNLTDSVSSMSDGTVINVKFSDTDLNNLKRLRICREQADCYLLHEFASVVDMAANDIELRSNGSGLQVSNHKPDITRPELLKFDVNLTAETITLYFTEVVDASSLNFSALTLQDFFQAEYTYTLTSGTVQKEDDTTIVFEFSLFDLNTIKRDTEIFTRQSNSYLTFTEYAIHDMALNPNSVVERLDGTLLESFAGVFVGDFTPPELWYFDLNLTSHQLTLYFSETVLAESFLVYEITLQSTANNTEGTESHTLSFQYSQLSTNFDYHVFVIDIGQVDTDAIKALTNLATSENNTFISFPSLTVQDMSENYITAISEYDAKPVRFFYEDTVPPKLVAFDLLDMDSGYIYLTFTEAVNATSLDVSKIAIQSAGNGTGAVSWTLTPLQADEGNVSVGNYSTVVLNETLYVNTSTNGTSSNMTASVNETSVNATSMDESTPTPLTMTVMNATESVSSLNGTSVNETNGNGTAGNMTVPMYGNLTTPMNDSAVLDSCDITLAPPAPGPDEEAASQRLQVFSPYHSFTTNEYVPVIKIRVGFTDLNAVKFHTELATLLNNTYISMTPEAVRDMNNNLLVPVLPQNASGVNTLVPDTTQPELVYYSLNLSSEVLSMTFTETVDVGSLAVMDITLQNEEFVYMTSSMFSRYPLLGGHSLTDSGFIQDLRLDTRDLNEIKKSTNLATSRNNTFIVFTTRLVSDMVGNRVVDISNGQAVQVEVFTADFVRPVLDNFHLDMNEGLLHLTFSETVNASSTDMTQITLQDGPTNATEYSRQLTESSYEVYGTYDTVVSIQLGYSDLNRIKYLPMFGLGVADTWIVATERLLLDMNDNMVLPLPDCAAKMATNYTADTTRPHLLSFHLDFIAEEMTLHFNEPVNVSAISYTSISLQDGPVAQYSRTLTGGVATALNDSLTIVISFNEADIAFLKMHPLLTTSTNDSFISLDSDAFYDQATDPNPVLPLLNEVNATIASTFLYYDFPVFVSVRPTAGRASGGTLITVEGMNFGPLPHHPGARRVDILLDFVLTVNATVVEADTVIEAITPTPNVLSVGSPVTLTVTVDNSALMLNISEAYLYLEAPVINRVYPTAATELGDTLVRVYGQNFGPSTESEMGPVVLVFIGNETCDNATVLNDTEITCLSPSLSPGTHNLTVVVDEVPVTLSGAYTSLPPPSVASVTPTSTYRYLPTQVNISGDLFGPTSESSDGLPVRVFITSQFGVSECSNVTVLAEDTLLTCTMEPNLGPSNITVVLDDVESLPSNATFFHYDNAGNFSFQVKEFFVSETELIGNVTVIRHDYPMFASPAEVTVWAYNGSASSGAHFEASNQTLPMPYLTNELSFPVNIMAGSYLPSRIRKGQSDDVSINVLITSVEPLRGDAAVSMDTAVLTIKAVCQAVTHVCWGVWDTDLNTVIYYRLEELP